MDYCRKVVPLEGSKNGDSLLKKLVHLVWMWMCVWVGGCVVCVYGGGWVDVWVCVWVNGWLCVCVEMGRGPVWCVCRGCVCRGEYFWKGMQTLILKSFGSVTVLVTLWPFTLVCSSVYDAM